MVLLSIFSQPKKDSLLEKSAKEAVTFQSNSPILLHELQEF